MNEPNLTGEDGGRDGSKIKIKISYGPRWLNLNVPSHITFGDLKRVIAEKTGLEPNVQRLFFRGIEKEDDIHLERAGLKNNSKLLLKDNSANKEKENSANKERENSANKESVKEVKVTEISKGSELVAEVKAEDDKLAQQVGALKKIICEGHTVVEKDLSFIVEMLERQLLKLDGIEAEGEGKVQRKMEVRRVQSLLDTADDLKKRNSPNPKSSDTVYPKSSDTVLATTSSETSEPASGNCDAQTSSSSSTKGTQDWEVFD